MICFIQFKIKKSTGSRYFTLHFARKSFRNGFLICRCFQTFLAPFRLSPPLRKKLKGEAQAEAAAAVRRAEAALKRHAAAPGKVVPAAPATDAVRA